MHSFKRTSLFLALLLILILLITGCSSKSKVTEDGYLELASLKGNSNMESSKFTVTVSDNRFVIKTTGNNKDGIRGQVISKESNAVKNSFSVGDTPIDDKWPFNLEPGTYTIKIESTGTNYEISYQEKQIKK